MINQLPIRKPKNTEMNTEKENMFYLFCVCHHGTGINFACQVLYLKEKSFCLVQLRALISSNKSNTGYHIPIHDYYRNKRRLFPSGHFSKTCFIMYIGKIHILGITFPLSLHKLLHNIPLTSLVFLYTVRLCNITTSQ